MNAQPLPLEQTNPELAQHILEIVNGQHAVRGFEVSQREFVFYMRDPRARPWIIGRKMPGRNDPCPCESGRKWKKCHGKN